MSPDTTTREPPIEGHSAPAKPAGEEHAVGSEQHEGREREARTRAAALRRVVATRRRACRPAPSPPPRGGRGPCRRRCRCRNSTHGASAVSCASANGAPQRRQVYGRARSFGRSRSEPNVRSRRAKRSASRERSRKKSASTVESAKRAGGTALHEGEALELLPPAPPLSPHEGHPQGDGPGQHHRYRGQPDERARASCSRLGDEASDELVREAPLVTYRPAVSHGLANVVGNRDLAAAVRARDGRSVVRWGRRAAGRTRHDGKARRRRLRRFGATGRRTRFDVSLAVPVVGLYRVEERTERLLLDRPLGFGHGQRLPLLSSHVQTKDLDVRPHELVRRRSRARSRGRSRRRWRRWSGG